jgi:hypothetical protein
MVGSTRSAQVEHRVEVDPERQLPVVGGDGQQVPAPVHSGVVHQDVDPAVALDDIVDRCDAGARLRQVEGDGFGSSAGLDDAGRDVTGPILVDVGDADVRALGGQPLGNGRADAAGRAGNHGDLVEEAVGIRRLRDLDHAPGSAKIARCHGLAATPVPSYITCLTTV